MKTSRIHTLDYLRGLAALGIMIYHYSSWTLGHFNSESILGKIGIYGVSLFYVLSGLTLYHVYYNKIESGIRSTASFLVKRFFRIFPLLWVATTVAILLSQNFPSWQKIILNYTGLFGLVNWNSYISAGAWSIGNELVFYLFFPLFVLFAKRGAVAVIIISALVLFSTVFFSFIVLTPSKSLSLQWRDYVNPLNQLVLFFGGFLIGYFFSAKKVNLILLRVTLLASLIAFVLFPVEGDRIHLVTGFNRLFFCAICFLICFCVYKDDYTLPQIIRKPFSLLGEASYSIYLLHPIMFSLTTTFVNEGAFQLRVIYVLLISSTTTLLISYVVYSNVEKPMMDLGRRLAEKYFKSNVDC